jgi:signal transduction histidine kinase/ligand-binding sensor domain-containing protein
MKLHTRTVIPFFCTQLFFCMQLSAQQPNVEGGHNFNPRFEVFTLPGDVFGNSVQGMVQDHSGFLWFATQGGLFRYDGQNYVTYRHDGNNPNSLSADYIESIFLDSKGVLWLTHWQAGALTAFDTERQVFTRYQHDPDDPESLSGNVLSTFAEDQQGYIWIGGEHGLNRYDPETGTFKRFQHDPENPNSLSYNRVRALYVDKAGTLWVGTGFPWDTESNEGGLNRYHPEDGTFTRYLHDPDDSTTPINNKVRSILEDSRGNFWIGTSGDGLHLMDREKGTFKRLTNDPSDPEKLSGPWKAGTVPAVSDYSTHISSIFEDDEGRIWITAFPGGLKLFDPVSGITRHFKMGSGTDELTTDFLWQTYQTSDGTLWITSGGDGQTIFKVKQFDDLFPFFDIPLSDDNVRSHGIIKDRAGHIWIARGASLERVDRVSGSRTVITLGNSQQPVTNIWGLRLDREGYLWAGTNNGQFRGDPETFDFRSFKPPGISDDILQAFWSSFLHSSSGHFWFGSWGYGLFRYDPVTDDVVNYAHNPNDPNSLSGNIVGSVYEDEMGNIWVGGGSLFGDILNPLFLDRINVQTNRIERFFDGNKQAGMVSDITEDNDGNIWFIDWIHGFKKLNPATGIFKSFTPYNSLLSSNYLLSLVNSGDGKLWLSDQSSIIEFDPETEIMSVFNQNRGIKNAYDHFKSGTVADDGELFFSRRGGFHAFYPDQILQQRNNRLPDIRITGFQMIGDQNPAAAYELFEKPIWQTEAIRLTHDQNLFAFSVACFDFYDASSNQLQFMLEGYDRAWRSDTRDGETSPYINVPPGDYTFRVRGANSFGVWNMEGASMGITILPPWWRTWWAYAFYVMLFIAGIVAVDRVQRRRVQQKERERAREKELEHAKEIEIAYRNLEVAHKNLEAAQDQLVQQEKLASLGQLTAGIAHEIKNPLNFVNNFSEVSEEMITELIDALNKGDIDESLALSKDIGANLKKIHEHGSRADSIVKSMLMHSRGGSGTMEPTDLNALIKEYVNLSYHGMRAGKDPIEVDIDLQLDQSIGEIPLIAEDFSRVILNLCNNAFDACAQRGSSENLPQSPGGSFESLPQSGSPRRVPPASAPSTTPRLTIRTAKNNGHVTIEIEDNGPGIPDEIKDKILQPFFTTKKGTQGTGLGLSITNDIIKAHGGSMDVQSKPGLTVFTIKLIG